MDQDEAEVDLEEGEISDDSDTYTPLERPSNYAHLTQTSAVRFPPLLEESDSEPDIIQSSDSDSDSDSQQQKNKKPKIKLKPKLHRKQTKYDIWSTRVQEDVLSETFNSCDVTKRDRSRDVETYDIVNRYCCDDNVEIGDRKNNKRTRDDRNNPNIKSVGKQDDEDRIKGQARKILDLTVTKESSKEDMVRDIANKLCEEREDLILKILNAIGVERTFDFFIETQRIEDQGGMLIMNQTRRRTPGGVFFYLIRQDPYLTPEQRDVIFDNDKETQKKLAKERKKKKLAKIKSEVAASKAKLLPDLLTRAELLTNDQNRIRKDTEERDVINPPPTPETDGHDNSGDGMDSATVPSNNTIAQMENNGRKLETYDEDFLDINCSNDMDLF